MLLEFFCNKQSNKRGWNPARGFQPYFFCPVKLLPDSNNLILYVAGPCKQYGEKKKTGKFLVDFPAFLDKLT